MPLPVLVVLQVDSPTVRGLRNLSEMPFFFFFLSFHVPVVCFAGCQESDKAAVLACVRNFCMLCLLVKHSFVDSA